MGSVEHLRTERWAILILNQLALGEIAGWSTVDAAIGAIILLVFNQAALARADLEAKLPWRTRRKVYE